MACGWKCVDAVSYTHLADFEQIIGDNGKIVHPLTDKTVKVSYVVTETATGEEKTTSDIDYIVKLSLIHI